MDSGLYVQVLSSPEVIAAALFLILLLPLVFFIASTRSRRPIVRVSTPRRSKPVAAKAEAEEEDDEPDPDDRA